MDVNEGGVCSDQRLEGMKKVGTNFRLIIVYVLRAGFLGVTSCFFSADIPQAFVSSPRIPESVTRRALLDTEHDKQAQSSQSTCRPDTQRPTPHLDAWNRGKKIGRG